MVPGRRPRRRAPTEGDGNGSSATMTLVDTRGRQGGVGRRVPARRRCDRPRGSLRAPPLIGDRAGGRHVFFFFLFIYFPVFFCFFLFFYFFTFIFYFLFYFFALLFLFISSFINCLFNTE
jgi:hypothetical protein